MRRITAVVFDLDGTLVDSAPDLRTALNRLLAEHGRRPLSLAEVTTMIGDGAAKLVERGFAATGAEAGDRLPALTDGFLAHYEGAASVETRPYPGVRELLATLRADGLALGVCTNKPEAPTREILRDLDLDGPFGAVFGGDTLDGIRKPDPRLLLAVLDTLGSTPEKAVMVGDNANDVGAARAAGMRVILRTGGYTVVPAEQLGADAVITGFDELPSVLKGLP